MGRSAFFTVKNAARLAVYDETKMRMQNQQHPARIRPEIQVTSNLRSRLCTTLLRIAYFENKGVFTEGADYMSRAGSVAGLAWSTKMTAQPGIT